MIQRTLALTAITLYIVAAIAGASYYAVEIRRLPPSEANLLIALILAILLGLPAIYALSHGAIEAKLRQSAFKGQIDARIAKLSVVPGAAPFLPLLRHGYALTEEELRSRIARAHEILAVPHRAPFVSRIYDGFLITDEQIDYLALPDRFALCEHFRPLESTLKQAGLLSYRSPGRLEGAFQPNVGKVPIPPGIKHEYISRSSPRQDDDYFLYQCTACGHTLIATCNGPIWPQ